MKRKSLIFAVLTSFAFGVALGVGENKANKVEEANAGNSYGHNWYVTGTYSGGSWGNFEGFTLNEYGTRYEKTITVTTSSEFKIFNSQSYSQPEINRSMNESQLDYNGKGWLLYTDWVAGNNFKMKYAGTFTLYYYSNVEDYDIFSWAFGIEPVDYIYYVTASSDETVDYIYGYGGGNEFSTWPGKQIKTVGTDVTNSAILKFQGNDIRVYKICLLPSITSTFVINNNGSSKTADLTTTSGAAYWWTDGANVDAGAALDLLVDTENTRNAVTASGSIKSYSICGIAPSKARSLYNTYYSFSAKETYIDSSKTYTYLDETGTDEGLVSFYDIFMELKQIAVSAGLSVSGTSTGLIGQVTSTDISSIITITVITTVAIAGCGAYFFFRKKREI